MGILGALGWFFQNLAMAFYNLGYAITHPASWLDWVIWTGTDEDKISLMRFIYYGASVEFFFVFLVVSLILLAIGFARREFMWGIVTTTEAFANVVGRYAAWAGLLMVLLQILIIFLQRIFAVADISMGFGVAMTFPVGWWAESLKFLSAVVICLCIPYTFVQGGHVRVDLIYSAVSHRTKRMIDMIGCWIFLLPTATFMWLYSWYYMWRRIVVPPVAPTDTLDRLVSAKWRGVRWNVETYGINGQSGFSAYFLFYILLVILCAMLFVLVIGFFARSYLEWKEGEGSVAKRLDKDRMGDETAELAAEIH